MPIVSSVAKSLPPSGTASGDLSGTYPGPTVAKVNGIAVTGTPNSGDVPTATGATAATWQAAAAGGVTSVFTRSGAVVAATNDYTDTQVQNSPTNILTATGDLLYASAANTLARRAIGSAGDYLVQSGGLPTWVTKARGQAKLTAGNYTTSSTTFADVDGTNAKVTVTTGANRVLISVSAVAFLSALNGLVGFDIDIDGARQGGTNGLVWVEQPSAAGDSENYSFTYMTAALSAASHVFKLQWRVSTGTATLYASSTGPLVLSVIEL